jgi:uncharacterized membrane-anchored protein YhcB (DUF1043 family)
MHGDNSHECSYSKVARGSTTCGLSCDAMTVLDYGDLMERGFRRCGSYYYKPNNFKNHWQWYTLRMDATKHKIRKSHQKAWNRWQRFLRGEKELKDEDGSEGQVEMKTEQIEEKKTEKKGSKETKAELNDNLKADVEAIYNKIQSGLYSLLKTLLPQDLPAEDLSQKEKSLDAFKTKISVLPDKKEAGVIFSNVLVLLKNVVQQDLPSIIQKAQKDCLDLFAYTTYSVSITVAMK